MADSNDLDNLQHRIDEAGKPGIVHKGVEKQDDVSDASREQLAKTTQLVWGLVSGAAIGCVGGYFLDRWLGTSPMFFIVCFFLGFAAGLYGLMKQVGKKE